ncbi:hypothetical protein LINPERPRIM_LOCUS24715 [Linum perenne]
MAEWSKAPDSSSGLRKRAWVQIPLLTNFFSCISKQILRDLWPNINKCRSFVLTGPNTITGPSKLVIGFILNWLHYVRICKVSNYHTQKNAIFEMG